MQAHRLLYHKADNSATGQASGSAGVKPADLLGREQNRDGMHVFGVGLAQLSDFG
jgi:hypothetical protein